MIFVALQEAADHGELILVDGGICRFHRRRDGIVTVREILVLPQQRRRGIARAMMVEVFRAAGGSAVQAKCPVAYESGQAFWRAMGFTLMAEKDGISLFQRPANP